MAETHVFVVWPKAAASRARILKDLERRFRVRDAIEVSWTESRFSRNMARFYGLYGWPLVRKVAHCGVGSFFAAVVDDDEPTYATRRTWAGPALVNVNVFEAKAAYRKWSGGGHRVHSSNDLREADHDLLFLLRRRTAFYASSPPWDGRITRLAVDPPGTHGWVSLGEALELLELKMPYSVITSLRSPAQEEEPEGVALLVPDALLAHAVLNTRRQKGLRRRRIIDVVKTPVPLRIFEVGDGSLDRKWQEDILARHCRDSAGVFIAAPTDRFYVELHHLARTKGTSGTAAFANAETGGTPTLDEFLAGHGYSRSHRSLALRLRDVARLASARVRMTASRSRYRPNASAVEHRIGLERPEAHHARD